MSVMTNIPSRELLTRSPANPLVTPEQVRPSRPDWTVDCTGEAAGGGCTGVDVGGTGVGEGTG